MSPLAIKHKAKFSIAFVLKISVVFFPKDDIFFQNIAEIFLKVMSQNVKIAFNFLFYLQRMGVYEMFYSVLSADNYFNPRTSFDLRMYTLPVPLHCTTSS